MGKWSHLFIDGEFAPRSRLLSGLTLEQVRAKPSAAAHSIHEELWHLTKWQSIVVQRDGPAADAWVSEGPRFPVTPLKSETDWRELVAEFMAGAEKAVEWGRSLAAVSEEVIPCVTLADVLESLAVHNAYHFGKIMALRQALGAWPATPE